MIARIPRGDLDRIIEIYQPVQTKGSMAGYKLDFSLYTKSWAMIEYQAGSESEVAEKQTAFTNIKITAPFISGLNQKMQVRFDDDDWRITDIQILGRNQYHVIMVDKSDAQ